jgi:Metallo-peptidase family M12/Glucodextranase, domain B/Divergent InlB B-repeat domain
LQRPSAARSRGLSALIVVLFSGSRDASAVQPLTGSPDGLWSIVAERQILAPGAGNRVLYPSAYRTVTLDVPAFKILAARAPLDLTRSADNAPVMTLPMPDGALARFRIWESPILEPALAARLPEVRTYRGLGIDEPTASAYLDLTSAGFHGFILSPKGTVFIDPYQRGDTTHYMSYWRRDYPRPEGIPPFYCDYERPGSLEEEGTRSEGLGLHASRPPLVAVGTVLRTYRLAVAGTAEFMAATGGTVALAQEAIITTINRVRGIFEREVCIRLVLIDNTSLIFSDPAKYTNGDPIAMLAENQRNLDAVVTTGNYDIGHVFGTYPTGGYGRAQVGVACTSGTKARGATTSQTPTNDSFAIDLVAHELGHQFGATHTFNGTTGTCASPNWWGPTAYEVGSGSTIMSYAGAGCGAENLTTSAPFSYKDPYFFTKSFEDIVAYTTAGNGACGAQTDTPGNNPPIVNAGPAITIPAQTPFVLNGSATDPGDTLTYCWEELDLGTPAPPNTDDGSRPIFRSFPPTLISSRTFPRLQDILAFSTFGESLPTTTRTMNFRLTARDNRVGGGGVNYASTTVAVIGSAGPFVVTLPEALASWSGGSSQTVNWDVANTNVAPVNCATVDIALSIDDGVTFPFPLATATANDGAQGVVVPNVPEADARVKVSCSNNTFFNISRRFLVVPGSQTLNVTVIGSGGGWVSSNPSGIANCTGTCSSGYVYGTPVMLSATQFGGSSFGGWSGEGCTGTGACQVTMTQARNVTATFIGAGAIAVFASPNPVAMGLGSVITATVRNGFGQAPPIGTPVTFATTFPGFFSQGGIFYGSGTGTTDGNGVATQRFTGNAGGTAVITVGSAGATAATVALQVNPPAGAGFVTVLASYFRGDASSTTYTITAVVKHADGTSVPYPWVDFSATSGAPASTRVQGAVDGSASFELTITLSGDVTVTATSGGVTGATSFLGQVGGAGTAMVPVRTLLTSDNSYGVEFSPDGTKLIAARELARTVQAWTTSSWSSIWSQTTGNYPMQVSVASTGNLFALATAQGVEIRSTTTGGKSCQANSTSTRFVKVRGSGGMASIQATTNTQFTVVIHPSTCSGGSPGPSQPPANEVFDLEANLAYAASKDMFAAASSIGDLWVWSGIGNLVTKQVLVDGYRGTDVAFSPDGSMLAAGAYGAFKVYNTSTWTARDYPVAEAGQKKTAVTFIDNGTKMAIGGLGGGLAIVDVASGATLRTATLPGSPITLAWNEATKDLAVSITNGGLVIFRPLDPPDTAGPLVSVAAPAQNQVTNQASVTTTGVVSDQTGVSTFTINSAAVALDASGGFSYTVSGLVEGVNTISYHAVDPLGNVTDTTVNVMRVVDHAPPVISGVAVAPGTGAPGTLFGISCIVVDGDTGVSSVAATVRNAAGSSVAANLVMANVGASNYAVGWNSAGFAPDAYSVDIAAVDSSPQLNSSVLIGAGSFTIAGPQALTVGRAGNGTGTVTSNPTGIDCGATCIANFSYYAQITLTAAASSGSVFSGWSGEGCSGTGTCQVSMTQGRTVTATFNASTPPTVSTTAATATTQTSAILNGTVNPNGASATTAFEYGLTTSYGITVAAQTLTGSTGQAISAAVSGLNCNTPYHFRAKAANSGGTNYGSDGTFTTSTCPVTPPTVTTGSATGVGQTGATLNGTVNPNGASTTTAFEYGPTTSYGNTVAAQTLTGSTGQAISAVVSGLTCNTPYHFRANATKSGVTTPGSDGTFTTLTCSDVQLSNGVPYASSIVATTTQGSWRYYYINVPSGATQFQVVLDSMSADVDLYVSLGSKPTLSVYGCRSFLVGTAAETCTFVSPAAGIWWIGVNNYATGTITYRVTASYAGPVGRTFNNLPPCRVFDTRMSLNGFSGLALQPYETRNYNVAGVCGIPSDAVAISVNLTVTNVGTLGELVVFPADVSRPNTSAISFRGGRTRANNAIVSFSFSQSSAAFSVFNNSTATVDFILDVNGFFR